VHFAVRRCQIPLNPPPPTGLFEKEREREREREREKKKKKKKKKKRRILIAGLILISRVDARSEIPNVRDVRPPPPFYRNLGRVSANLD